jgi:hypothetical protein
MKKVSLLFAIAMLISNGLLAQIGPPPPPAPLDGGAGVLLVLGVAYGVKKIYDSSDTQEKV